MQPAHKITEENTNARKEDPDSHQSSLVDAIHRVQAVIEFNLDGTIRTANENFLNTVGYSLDEIKGKHHRIFCEQMYAQSEEYKLFWKKLNEGHFETGEFRRLGKGGKEVWINASYNPIFGENGQVTKVVKFASDITESKNRQAEFEAKIAAISKSQAVIEFNLDGTIVTANENFLKTVGYDLEEIEGRHHRMFCEESYANSEDYKLFWQNLRNGNFSSSEYKRLGKGGKEVWIQASYNPVFDATGKPIKVVKFASDITEQVKTRETAKTLSLVANETDNSVIICDALGRIEYVNPGFTKLTGYQFSECLGKRPGAILQGKLTDLETRKRIRSKLEAKKPFYDEILNYNKQGQAYWISLAINPVFNEKNEVEKFISIQTNITEVKQQQLAYNTQLEAISASSAIVEYTPDGKVINANSNFLALMEYQDAEIKEKDHRIFCDEETANSLEYKTFWIRLGNGDQQSGKYLRSSKSGKPVYLNASYNPIANQEGQIVKVVMFGIDVTDQVEVEKEVTNVSQNFANKADEISNQAASVAQKAQTLGATAEEMSASVEELSASIDSIAQNSRASSEIAMQTQAEADQGVQGINRSIESMDLINKSSEEVSEIVKVISEIASQTNLLAFNAAIEAARAGEHGLGFSVVADEVRKLAERSSQATKDISKLINETVKRVEQGTEISKQAAVSFKKIVEGVGKTTQSIAEISTAAQEQQAASRDVAKAIQQVAEATDQAAISSDAIAGATSDLTSGAENLKRIVKRFAS